MPAQINQAIWDGATAISTDSQSAAVFIDDRSGVSVVVTSTGNLKGTLKLQASNDGETWIDLPTATVSIGGPGSVGLQAESFFRAARVVFMRTSGTGALTGILYAKT